MKKVIKEYYGLFLLIGITGLLCYWLLYSLVFRDHLSLNKTGSIGDTVNGLTAPIIGMLSITLIYLSFKEQFKANKIQREALEREIKRSNTLKEFEQVIDLLNDVRREFDNLAINSSSNKAAYGEVTLNKMEYLNSEDKYQDYIIKLSKSIILLSFIGDKVQSFDFDIRDEDVIYEKFSLIYTENVHKGLETLNKTVIPYPENKLIELKRKMISLHTGKILKYNDYYFTKHAKISDEKMKKVKEYNHYREKLTV